MRKTGKVESGTERGEARRASGGWCWLLNGYTLPAPVSVPDVMRRACCAAFATCRAHKVKHGTAEHLLCGTFFMVASLPGFPLFWAMTQGKVEGCSFSCFSLWAKHSLWVNRAARVTLVGWTVPSSLRLSFVFFVLHMRISCSALFGVLRLCSLSSFLRSAFLRFPALVLLGCWKTTSKDTFLSCCSDRLAL